MANNKNTHSSHNKERQRADNQKPVQNAFEQCTDIQPMILITISPYGTSCHISKRPAAAPAETKHNRL